jgi:histidinol-phosphate/aromatic aminotransferase/cobyric acid decarboxylase-like protein
MADVNAFSGTHGGLVHDELSRLGVSPEDVLDLSVNVNPYGPCEEVVRAISAAPIHRYPDPTALPARRELSRWLDVPAARIALGNGAVDLMWGLARVLLRPSATVLIVEPAFSEMRRAALSVGAQVIEYRTDATRDFELDLGALDRCLARTRPVLAYVCTPSNPSGTYTSVDAIGELATKHPDTRFVLDASFLSLSAHPSADVARASQRLFWLQSLTKDLALAGLRVGFAVCPDDIVNAIEAQRPPWSVNALAQAAAISACAEPVRRFVDSSRRRLLTDRAQLEYSLRDLGLHVHPSDTVYSLVDLGGSVDATTLRHRLLTEHGVLVRDATSFGLPTHIRVGARPAADREKFVPALRAVLGRGN